MNTFIRIAVFCVLLSVGLVEGQKSYVAYCEECVKESQQAPLFAHPERCDLYIQCDIREEFKKAYVKACAGGTFFNPKIKNCDHEPKNCNATCVSGKRFKSNRQCNEYYECVDNKFNATVRTCPDKFAVNADTGECVSDPKCPPKDRAVACPNFVVDNNPQIYYHYGVKQQCGSGQIFNLTICSCQLVINPPTDPICTLYDVSMVNDLAEISGPRSVLNNSVFIVGNAAYFKDASLVLPAFTMNDFRDKIQIDISFRYESPTKDDVAVLSNGNCNLAPTISLILKDALTPNCYLEASMKIQGERKPVTFQTPVNPNVWYSFIFVKKGNQISLSKDGAIVGQIEIAGDFQFQDAALVLGKSPQIGSYTGSMKNLRVSKCPA